MKASGAPIFGVPSKVGGARGSANPAKTGWTPPSRNIFDIKKKASGAAPKGARRPTYNRYEDDKKGYTYPI